jgi:FkbM family methyltransferase
LNYEPHVIAELRKHIPNASGFLDIGANVGLMTIAAKSIRSDIPIWAFEVSPSNVACLLRTIDANKIEGATVVPVALADNPQIIMRNLDSGNTKCSTVAHDGIEEYPEYGCALSLDTLNLPPIDLIKMDVEGFELLVLKGASQVLRSRPRIIFEYQTLGKIELLHFLLDHGYLLTVLDYKPGIRKTFTDAQECHDYALATCGQITDILAE